MAICSEEEVEEEVPEMDEEVPETEEIPDTCLPGEEEDAEEELPLEAVVSEIFLGDGGGVSGDVPQNWCNSFQDVPGAANGVRGGGDRSQDLH